MRSIPCPFDVKVFLNADGSYNEEASKEQFADLLADASEDRSNGTVTVIEKVREIYESSGEATLPRGSVNTQVMTALGANASNWGAKQKLVNEVLATCLISAGKTGARMVSAEEAQASREQRAERRAANKLAKAAK